MNGCLHLAFIGPGGPEMIVVMLILLVLFGANDAPRMFRKLFDMLNQIRRTADNFKHEIMYSDLNHGRKTADDLADYDDYGLGADTGLEDEPAEAAEEPEDSAIDEDDGEGDAKPV